MLHIILLILKIIGIVLLCILGLLLLSVLCALFVPVRYRIEVLREEGEGKPPVQVYVKVTWLLHLVNILIRYPAEVIIRARVLLFTVFRLPAKEGKDGGKPKKPKKTKQPDEAPTEMEAEAGTEASETAAVTRDAQTPAKDAAEENAGDVYTPFESGMPDEETEAGTEADGTEADGTEAGKKSLAGRIREILSKIKALPAKIKQVVEQIEAFFENIQYTIRKFCDKIKATLDNIQYYREVLESEACRRSLALCKDELGYVLRKLKPDRFEADLTVGMEDPAATGQILAVYGMLYPFVGQHVRLKGLFDNERTHIEGDVYIRGRLRAYTFVRVLLRVYRSRDMRKLIKLFKKEAA